MRTRKNRIRAEWEIGKALLVISYFGDDPVLPLGEAVGGHGVPLGETPAELPWLLPEVEGDEPGLDVPGLDDPGLEGPLVDEPAVDDPGFDDPEDPEFDEPEVPVVPGKVPHGDPLGLVPGVVEVFGFTVEG